MTRRNKIVISDQCQCIGLPLGEKDHLGFTEVLVFYSCAAEYDGQLRIDSLTNVRPCSEEVAEFAVGRLKEALRQADERADVIERLRELAETLRFPLGAQGKR